jgi:hypothetical protein
MDSAGQEKVLAPAVALGVQPPGGFQARVLIEGKRLEASVGSVELKSELATALNPGHAGVAVGKTGRVEVRDWRIQGVGHQGPKGPRK